MQRIPASYALIGVNEEADRSARSTWFLAAIMITMIVLALAAATRPAFASDSKNDKVVLKKDEDAKEEDGHGADDDSDGDINARAASGSGGGNSGSGGSNSGGGKSGGSGGGNSGGSGGSKSGGSGGGNSGGGSDSGSGGSGSDSGGNRPDNKPSNDDGNDVGAGDDRNDTRGDNQEDSGQPDEVLGGNFNRPSGPTRTHVLGGRVGRAPAVAPGVAARAEVRGRQLPFTGMPVGAWLMTAFGLLGSGSYLVRRRRKS